MFTAISRPLPCAWDPENREGWTWGEEVSKDIQAPMGVKKIFRDADLDPNPSSLPLHRPVMHPEPRHEGENEHRCVADVYCRPQTEHLPK